MGIKHVCSITINKTVDEILESDNQIRSQIEERMIALAKDSSIASRGALDEISPMTRMPKDLRHIRKKTIGRHRVYFHGHHTDCCFHIVYVKAFKRKGRNDDDDRKFQWILSRASSDMNSRRLT